MLGSIDPSNLYSIFKLNTRELLSHLSKLETGLDNFSFTELNSKEAQKLKQSFETFKTGLEEKVFGEPESAAAKSARPSEAETTLVANVSHEIRTPLNGILGFIELLRETELDVEQQQLVNAMGTASNHLMDIINELLEFSKLAAGRETFEQVPFHLVNLVKEVTFLCQTLITESQVKLKVEIDENIPNHLIGDPSKLSQILLNLMGNAIKFVKEGEVRLNIRIKGNEKQRTYLEFEVSDTGIGIANDQLKRIFESYQLAEDDTFAKYGGSGLGLSIVKEIVEKQQGCIAVKSTLGVGTTFQVILPFGKTKEMTTESVPPVAKPNLDPKSIRGARILVFEDNTMNQKLMYNRLKNWGCKSYITENGIYGLKLLENHPIDLVLMDLRMPGMNGLEITKRIRESHIARVRNIPIIAVSADFSLNDQKHCRQWGINDFILKPYDSEELQLMIANHMAQSVTQHLGFNETAATSQRYPLINLDPIEKECLGQIELLEELVRLFKQNMLEFIGNVKLHIDGRNIQGIGFAAHKIKSSLKMMEAKSLSELCEQLSEECKDGGDFQVLKNLYLEFVEAYPQVEQLLDQEMEKRKS